jgi:hypothetical protein
MGGIGSVARTFNGGYDFPAIIVNSNITWTISTDTSYDSITVNAGKTLTIYISNGANLIVPNNNDFVINGAVNFINSSGSNGLQVTGILDINSGGGLDVNNNAFNMNISTLDLDGSITGGGNFYTFNVTTANINNSCSIASGVLDLNDITNFNLGTDVSITAGGTLTMPSKTSYTVPSNTSLTGRIVVWNIENLTVPANSSLKATADNFNIGTENYSTINFTNLKNLTVSGTVTGNIYETGLIDIIVNTGGIISANEKGYGSGVYIDGYGPGGGKASTEDNCAGGGGGYGGIGGYGAWGSGAGAGGSTYGSVSNPTDLGSGGGGANTVVGGSGGGAIRLSLSGTLTNNGTIKANGGAGGIGGANSGGAGSGGSIWIETKMLAGNGNGKFYANGGTGLIDSTRQGGAGGGGRIAIWCPTRTPEEVISMFNLAKPLPGTAAGIGGAGTLYIKRYRCTTIAVE